MSLNDILAPLSLPISQALGLPRLPSHFSTILLSSLFYYFIQWASPFVFNKLSPEHYGKASRRVKQGWASKTCSTINALILVPLAFRCLYLPELDNDRVWGTHQLEGELEALACGFVWDAIEECFVHFQDIRYALHGITVLFALSLTFRPLFAYTSVRFLLLEISTPFVNMHWLFKKIGRSESMLDNINGGVLIITYFLARICYGSLTAYRFMFTLYEARDGVPRNLGIIYAVGTLALQYLNWAWLFKILYLLMKRLSTKEKTKEL